MAVEQRSPYLEIFCFVVEMKALGEEGSPGDWTSPALGTRVLKGNKQMPGLGWSDRGVLAMCGASAAIN